MRRQRRRWRIKRKQQRMTTFTIQNVNDKMFLGKLQTNGKPHHCLQILNIVVQSNVNPLFPIFSFSSVSFSGCLSKFFRLLEFWPLYECTKLLTGKNAREFTMLGPGKLTRKLPYTTGCSVNAFELTEVFLPFFNSKWKQKKITKSYSPKM